VTEVKDDQGKLRLKYVYGSHPTNRNYENPVVGIFGGFSF
jgi:hypothetical protein